MQLRVHKHLGLFFSRRLAGSLEGVRQFLLLSRDAKDSLFELFPAQFHEILPLANHEVDESSLGYRNWIEIHFARKEHLTLKDGSDAWTV